MPSLQTRLGISLFISLTAATLILWFALSASVRYLAEDYISTRLQHDSESILNALSFNPDGRPAIDKTRLDAIYQKPFSGHYYKIISQQHILHSRSLWDQNLDTGPLTPGIQRTQHLTGPENQPLLVLVTGYRKQNLPVSIAVAEDLSPVESDLSRLQWQFTLAALATLVLLVLVQVYIVRRSLNPLNRIQAELRELEQGLRQSLDTHAPSEVSPLINEINRLIKVTNQRLQRSRHALGDLAHTLKKPLTVLKQLTNDPALTDNRNLKDTLEEQTTAMHRSMDRVLKQARIAGEGAAGSSFAVTRETASLLKVLKTLYHDKQLDIETQIPSDLVIAYDREDMHEMLGNVMDNAFKWARHAVSVSVQADKDIIFRIEDDGEGADPALLSRLTERGTRLDESVNGHGIGLGIVKDIVNQYHGTLVFSRSDKLGGFCTEISLPAHYSAD